MNWATNGSRSAGTMATRSRSSRRPSPAGIAKCGCAARNWSCATALLQRHVRGRHKNHRGRLAAGPGAAAGRCGIAAGSFRPAGGVGRGLHQQNASVGNAIESYGGTWSCAQTRADARVKPVVPVVNGEPPRNNFKCYSWTTASVSGNVHGAVFHFVEPDMGDSHCRVRRPRAGSLAAASD